MPFPYTFPFKFVVLYPLDPLIRVGSLVHRYDRKHGEYSLEIILGNITSEYGVPEWDSVAQSASQQSIVDIAPDSSVVYGAREYYTTREALTARGEFLSALGIHYRLHWGGGEAWIEPYKS